MTQAAQVDVQARLLNIDFDRPGEFRKALLLGSQVQQKLARREFEQAKQLAAPSNPKAFAKLQKKAHIAANRIREMTRVILETDLTVPLPRHQPQAGPRASFLRQRLQERKKGDLYYQQALPRVFTRPRAKAAFVRPESSAQAALAAGARESGRAEASPRQSDGSRLAEGSSGSARTRMDSIRGADLRRPANQSDSVAREMPGLVPARATKPAAAVSRRQDLIDSLVEVKNLMMKSIMKVIGMGMAKEADDGLQVDRLDLFHSLKSEIAQLQAAAEQADSLTLQEARRLENRIDAVKCSAQHILYNPREANLNFYKKLNLNNEMVRKYASQPLFDEEMVRRLKKAQLQFGLSGEEIRKRNKSWARKHLNKSHESPAPPLGRGLHTRSFSNPFAASGPDFVQATSAKSIELSKQDSDSRSREQANQTTAMRSHAASHSSQLAKSTVSQKDLILSQIEKSDRFLKANKPFYRKLKKHKKQARQARVEEAGDSQARPNPIARMLQAFDSSGSGAQHDYASNMLDKYSYLEEQVQLLQQSLKPEFPPKARAEKCRPLKLEKSKEQLASVFRSRAADCKQVIDRLERPAQAALRSGNPNLRSLQEATDIANWSGAEPESRFFAAEAFPELRASQAAAYFPELQAARHSALLGASLQKQAPQSPEPVRP